MLGLGNNLIKAAIRIAATIKKYWEDDFDFWEAAGTKWENKTGGEEAAPPGAPD